jgi:hypothetical protein
MTDEEKFQAWLKTDEGKLCSRDDLLHSVSYKVIFMRRLKATFIAGINRAVDLQP